MSSSTGPSSAGLGEGAGDGTFRDEPPTQRPKKLLDLIDTASALLAEDCMLLFEGFLEGALEVAGVL